MLCLLLVLGCRDGNGAGDGRPPATAIAGSAAAAQATAPLSPRLTEPPFSELAFVPGDCEALVRVDLAAVAARDPDAGRMLDFLLRAQQPAAWEFMSAARIAPGKELRAVYLVVGPRANATSSFLLAGVGKVDRALAVAALRETGGRSEAVPGAGEVFTWRRRGPAETSPVGANLPPEGTRVDEAVVGIADGLLLVGTDALVRKALDTLVGRGDDVRRSPLAAELVALDGTALAWGAARGDLPEAYLPTVAPGFRQARFAASLDDHGAGLRLRAEFATAEDARRTRDALAELLKQAVAMTGDTPVGAMIRELRDSAVLTATGAVLTADARVRP